jgi:HAD superfamily hydrolase (TIGR01509 family)
MRVRHLFDCVVASGEHPELRRLKPAPDAFLIAARTLGVQPDECLIIGDRQDADGEAARAANMAFELIE